MATGTVKFFNPDKGEGIIAIDGGRDIYFHAWEIRSGGFKIVEEGQRVKFEIVKDRYEGWLAEQVEVIDLPPSRDIM